MDIISSVDHPAFEGVNLALITPESENSDLHDQLLAVEDVHPINPDQLLNYRLGHQGFNKKCYALVEGRSVLSAIYTHAAYYDEQIPYQAKLPGRVDTILRTPSAPLEKNPDVMAFYSILRTSLRKGAGELLILTLHREFKRAAACPILTTLSPLRGLSSWAVENGYTDDDDSFQIAVKFLKEKTHKVQGFHQKNGAVIGAIHCGANEEGTEDYAKGRNVMVSYDYSQDAKALRENHRKFMSDGELPPVASYLAPLFA